jgi:branched-chain amino acid transport system substrate-binding protein
VQARVSLVSSCLALAVAVAVCGCGSSGGSKSGGPSSATLDLYSSLPLQGASKDQAGAIVQGIRLAVDDAGRKAGKFKINYVSLDDSVAQTGAWDPGQVANDARKASEDSKAIGYIGEFNSGGSAVSIPIINQAGIAQISPTNTYVGLTTNEAGSVKGEPLKYYPTGKRTYMRIVPRDTIQAAAVLQLVKQDGCRKVALANDKDTYGIGLSSLIKLQASKFGVSLTPNVGIQKDAANFRSVAASFKAQGADCGIFAGIVANGAVQFYKDFVGAIPNAKIYGADGVCESGLTNPAKHGLPAALGQRFKCTIATLNLPSYPGGQDFLKKFKAKYGTTHADPYAIYGYECGKLFMDTIAKLGDKGGDRQAVLSSLLATKDRNSVLGTYSFDKNGDTSLTDYGVYKVGSDGNPLFAETIKGG